MPPPPSSHPPALEQLITVLRALQLELLSTAQPLLALLLLQLPPSPHPFAMPGKAVTSSQLVHALRLLAMLRTFAPHKSVSQDSVPNATQPPVQVLNAHPPVPMTPGTPVAVTESA